MKTRLLWLIVGVFILWLILGAFLLIRLTGCCNKDTISSSTLLGYGTMSFEETIKNYIEDMKNEEVSNVSYGWKEGWDGSFAPNSDVLISNEVAMTYVISVNLDYNGEVETNRMIYYMIHNIEDNTLSVQGGVFEEDGDIYPMSLSEARNELEEIFKEYN